MYACMYQCVCVCACMYKYKVYYAYLHACMYAYVCLVVWMHGCPCMYVYMHACMYVRVRVQMCVILCVCGYIYMCVCARVCLICGYIEDIQYSVFYLHRNTVFWQICVGVHMHMYLFVHSIGALIVRIGLRCILYYRYNEEPPK